MERPPATFHRRGNRGGGLSPPTIYLGVAEPPHFYLWVLPPIFSTCSSPLGYSMNVVHAHAQHAQCS